MKLLIKSYSLETVGGAKPGHLITAKGEADAPDKPARFLKLAPSRYYLANVIRLSDWSIEYIEPGMPCFDYGFLPDLIDATAALIPPTEIVQERDLHGLLRMP